MDDVIRIKLEWQGVTDLKIFDGIITNLNFDGDRLVIPDGVVKLSDFSCSGLPNVTVVNLPVSLKEIGKGVFANSPRLRIILAPPHLKRFGCFLTSNNNSEVVYVSRNKVE